MKQPTPPHAKKVFIGKIFDVYQWEQKMFDGSIEIFEKLKRPDTVVVFGILDDGKILLIEQEQPGKQTFISAPGGRVEEGEEILEAAKRELLEETGYQASEFILWKSEQPVSKIDWTVHVFVAKGMKKIAEPDLDPGEKIKLKPVTFEELINLAIEDENFAEKEILIDICRAMLNADKMKELKDLFCQKINK